LVGKLLGNASRYEWVEKFTAHNAWEKGRKVRRGKEEERRK
jgi:hypothetical protein